MHVQTAVPYSATALATCRSRRKARENRKLVAHAGRRGRPGNSQNGSVPAGHPTPRRRAGHARVLFRAAPLPFAVGAALFPDWQTHCKGTTKKADRRWHPSLPLLKMGGAAGYERVRTSERR